MEPKNLGAAKRQLQGAADALERVMDELRDANQEIGRLRAAEDNSQRIIATLLEDLGGEARIPLQYLRSVRGIDITQETDGRGPIVVIRAKEPRDG